MANKIVIYVSRETLEDVMDEYYMNLAIEMAKKAYKKNEIPVGTVIVGNNKIIAKAYNKKECKKNPVMHSEIIAIEKASKKNKNWRLDNCVLYTTMEPCKMCCGAIEQSRIKKVVYGTKNEFYGHSSELNNVEVVYGVKEKECRQLIQDFFKKRR